MQVVEITAIKFPSLPVVILVLGLLISVTLVYASANAQVTQQPQPPILAAYVQKDFSNSYGNHSRFNIQAPAYIDLSRFPGGQLYKITSDDQVWASVFEDSGSFYITGTLHNQIQNQTHITREIVDISGYSQFNTIEEDIATGVTNYVIEPGAFSVGKVSLSGVPFIFQTLKNGTGVLHVY